MYKIALICEHGASTGLCVQKMIAAAKTIGVEAEIASYSVTQTDNLVKNMDVLLIGPQLSYRLENLKSSYPQQAGKFAAINPIDFGMMDGAKILKDAVALAGKSR
ncbi:MAG: PTS sugar transporter subunit IIB [Spirochaetaceae bacterium]|nr:PTS sugar transporter subunit IIB [Spirochaetaceae bacterium]